MVIKVGINGFGRIGRIVFRTCFQNPELEVTAINDPVVDIEYICYLIKFDSTHGKLTCDLTHNGTEIRINGKSINVWHHKLPVDIPWHTAGVQYVVEASGMFSTSDKASGHLDEDGVKRVILTAPSLDIPILVLGVNDDTITAEMKVLSCGSSTLYCLAPIVKVLVDNFGVEEGFVTTIHAMTPSLKPIDGLCPRGKHWREHRSITQNIIPATTGACKALAKVVPQAKDRIIGLAFRVPIANVSVLDLSIRLAKNTTLEAIVESVKKASMSSYLGIITTVDEENVSSDFIGDLHSCILDTTSCLQLKPNFFKLVCWYENEYSYACRVVDSILFSEKQFHEAESTKSINALPMSNLLEKIYTLQQIINAKTVEKQSDDLQNEINKETLENTDYTQPPKVFDAPVRSDSPLRVVKDEAQIRAFDGILNICNDYPKCVTHSNKILTTAHSPQLETPVDRMKTCHRLKKVRKEFYKMIHMTEGLMKKANTNKNKPVRIKHSSDSYKDESPSCSSSNTDNKRETNDAVEASCNKILPKLKLELSYRTLYRKDDPKITNAADNKTPSELCDEIMARCKSYDSKFIYSVSEIKNLFEDPNCLHLRHGRQSMPVIKQGTVPKNPTDINPKESGEAFPEDYMRVQKDNSILDSSDSSVANATEFIEFNKIDYKMTENQLHQARLEHLKQATFRTSQGNCEETVVKANTGWQFVENNKLADDHYGKQRNITVAPDKKDVSILNNESNKQPKRSLKFIPEELHTVQKRLIKPEKVTKCEYETDSMKTRPKCNFCNPATLTEKPLQEISENEMEATIWNKKGQTLNKNMNNETSRLNDEQHVELTTDMNIANNICSNLEASPKTSEFQFAIDNENDGITDVQSEETNPNEYRTELNTKYNDRTVNQVRSIQEEEMVSFSEAASEDTPSTEMNVLDLEDNQKGNTETSEWSQRSISLLDNQSKISFASVTSSYADKQETSMECVAESKEESVSSVKDDPERRGFHNEHESQLMKTNAKLSNSQLSKLEYDIDKLLDISSTSMETPKPFDLSTLNLFDEQLKKRKIQLGHDDADSKTCENLSRTAQLKINKFMHVYKDNDYCSSYDTAETLRLAASSAYTSCLNSSQGDIYDKLNSPNSSDSATSFVMDGKKSQVINIKELTRSWDDLERLDKICRIMEISDELSDKLFSTLDTVAKANSSTKTNKWSFKDLCEKIKLDEFCSKIFGK